MGKLDNYYGRLFTQAQLSDTLKRQVKQLPAMTKLNHHYVCNRRDSQVSLQNKFQTNVFYCRNCLVFGRNTSNGYLYYLPQKRFSKKASSIWKGKLTPYQDDVSKGMLKGIDAKEDLPIHVITGARGTEIIYQSVSKTIDDGGCVYLASPRIGVCLEFYRRLSRDFSCPIALLYGDSEPYKRAPLIIVTIHQLLRFCQIFDLLIIDEVDALPFVGNTVLYHAVDKAVKPNGAKIFLTATSIGGLDKKVKTGTLTKLHLARRFHAGPLVVPQKIWLSGVLSNIQKKKIPRRLISLLKKRRQTCYPSLTFSPNIKQEGAFTQVSQTYFPEEQIVSVSSKTENRLETVEKFRKQELSILVAATVLERGVTSPCVDVFIVLVNHRLYTKSVLVRISGRVGKAAEHPTGELLFLHDGNIKGMRRAIVEIKATSKKGGFAWSTCFADENFPEKNNF